MSTRSGDVHAEVKSPLDVPENMLDQVQMWLARCMHIETSLLNSVHNVKGT